MRKIISGLLIGLLFMGCAKQETTYTIQGEWKGGDGKVVYLKKDLGDKKYEVLDSVVVANGRFKMQNLLGDVDERILEILFVVFAQRRRRKKDRRAGDPFWF